ncbi:hypothetical protein ASD64_13160 [Mesorhizobium sp. Root157]|uniref:hypothetical protein n=1 Tax=Mesorhizobium sp. Root157 TaxID=1736477 RepID=UPI0007019429|nr:hypothetical protein [Mesorhizobium sp. Root157]KQZ78276.1 hypothetical protein ASD64_13160 [Mesorhizobium sp. Root157]
MQSNQIVYPKVLPWLAAGAILFGIGLLIGLWYQPYPELEAALFSENGLVETPEMIALGLFAYLYLIAFGIWMHKNS